MCTLTEVGEHRTGMLKRKGQRLTGEQRGDGWKGTLTHSERRPQIFIPKRK